MEEFPTRLDIFLQFQLVALKEFNDFSSECGKNWKRLFKKSVLESVGKILSLGVSDTNVSSLVSSQIVELS